MKWKYRETDKELNERFTKKMIDEEYIQIKTCCDCDMYIRITQQFNYEYTTQSFIKKTCDIHKQQALDKYLDKIRSKLK